MARMSRPAAAYGRFRNRLSARLSARTKPATGFLSNPEPHTIGYVARGRQLLAGNLMFAGHLVETPGLPWDVTPPSPAYAADLHAFTWLDDLAAVGDATARVQAQKWTWDWIRRYGRGKGPGWTPDLTGRRTIRWVQHAIFLLRGHDRVRADLFYAALSRQAEFLSRRGRAAGPGLPRFEAMTGLLYAGLSLEGMQHHIAPAREALGAECARMIDEGGGIPTRNPEELLEVFTLLTWAQEALDAADMTPTDAHSAALARMAPTLRALRHADGSLGRFHGGGRGVDGRLDEALASSGVRRRRKEGLAMGFARLSAGRTSVLIDAALPPAGRASANAHASTLAMELTSGRRPVLVNCGAGHAFGPDWRRAGRATPSHSVLCLDGCSSSRLADPENFGDEMREYLRDGPRTVQVEQTRPAEGYRFEGAHDGYVPATGLTHARSVLLSLDGRTLEGEDFLVTLEPEHKKRFDRAVDEGGLSGLSFDIHFHLHPDLEVSLDLGGRVASVTLRSGEVWVFRFEGDVSMRIEPSVLLEKGRIRPRATKQIVLSGRAMGYSTRVRWSLAKAQDTALAVRDLVMDEVDPF